MVNALEELNISGQGGAGGHAGPSSASQNLGGVLFGDNVWGGKGVPVWLVVAVVIGAWLFLRKGK